MTASCACVVTAKTAGRIETEVLVGGELSSRKGVSLPDTVLPLSPLTETDRENLEYAANLGVDWIALSFVQRAEDVVEAKQLIDGRAAVMSKIEKPVRRHRYRAESWPNPTPSWSRAAISASNCRCSRCPACRSG